MSNARCNEAVASTTATTSITTKTVETEPSASVAHFTPPIPTLSTAIPCRINGLKGYQNRTNNIIYCPPLTRPVSHKEKCTAVIYFGGDVQDVPEKMESNRDNKNYIMWNLENTATLLREGFPRSHIIVVRPMRMEYSTFSCFDNFVRGNNAGIPDHTPMHYSLQHLEELLVSLTKKLTKPVLDHEMLQKLIFASENTLPLKPDAGKLKRCNASLSEADFLPNTDFYETPQAQADIKELLWWRENLNLETATLKLVGFSKGCVVLNQFIYEFHYYKTLTPDDSTMMRLVSRISDMYWLDGGHSGGKNTWITSRSLLETLSRLSINIHAHVTPYQIQDEHRPWIRKEEKTFSEMLTQLGAAYHRSVYMSEANSTNLYTHFDVLTRFRMHQISVFSLQMNQLLAGNNQQSLSPAVHRAIEENNQLDYVGVMLARRRDRIPLLRRSRKTRKRC
ncbi:mitochondrial protein C2orf69 homolog isoform X2 [Anopheles bellator]|uniref:mitochondrial protein C2orf69 homolog isoform X2 n=1 Tax=Anopheles bellator TaxID=139047 RepID=UPI0026481007|nr:mitochondrial protein C2orf69 homolog isoform X2 [Anopheles bellator]